MKTQLAGLEVKYIVDELKSVEGGRVDQIYQIGKRELYLQFHVSGEGKKIVRVLVPNFMGFVSERKPSPENLMGFCGFLRKRLGNARVVSVEQRRGERVVEIKLRLKDGSYIFIIELFDKGNVVLCDKEGIVLNAIEQHKWKDREVMKGKKYSLVEKKHDFFSIDKKEFSELMSEMPRDSIVKTLAIELGLGGLYSEEVCVVAGIDKSKAEVDSDDVDKLYSAVEDLRKRKVKATVYGNEIVPFEMKSLSGKGRSYPSFSSAIEAEFDEEKLVSLKKESRVDEIKRIIADQEQKMVQMSDEIDANKIKAEKIYAKYNVVKEVLDEIGKAKEKYSWDEICKRLKGHKFVKEVNAKDKKVVVEL